MDSVHRKSSAEYDTIKRTEIVSRNARREQWPEFSEYTDKYLLHSKTEPKTTGWELWVDSVTCDKWKKNVKLKYSRVPL